MDLLSQLLKQTFDLSVLSIAAATSLMFVAGTRLSRVARRAGRATKR
ncbi:MAG: hypothetical protein QOG54_2287 [Actinomycetota bacterium]|jgi:hypothetical protein|nr:hypothetical protein [Actinomycetota bacterium]